ncbi:MAG: DNA repair protein RecN [Bacillota bacterium]|nr:DNA repair protein RecN [Bacillota bacterium]
MLTHINIRDFAIIEEIDLDLYPGFNVITGETGAGKSIIIEAMSMALGGRADTSYVRRGKEKAVIRLVLEWEDPDTALLLEEAGLEAETPLVLTREIFASGKSLCRVGTDPVPLSFLKRLCARLADIHGQYDHQSLLDPENHLKLLDLYGGPPLAELREETASLFSSYSHTKKELEQLRSRLADREKKRDFMAFELQEIREACPVPGEDGEWENRLLLLQNSERIHRALSESYALLMEGSLTEELGRALRLLEDVQGFSPEISALREKTAECYYAIADDIGPQLRKCRESMDFSPEALEEALARTELLNKLKRKYGPSIEDVIAYAQGLERDLEQIDGADRQAEALTCRLEELEAELRLACRRLSLLRRETGEKVAALINEQLRELNFKNASLSLSFSQESGFTANGTDRMEFLIVTNRGEEPKPLARIASGGEISRIMLAFKCVLGRADRIPTMIFDEIDSGISGATASIVGKKLFQLGRERQLLCITHLPQIVAFGERHYKIEKLDRAEDAAVTVTPLNEETRLKELARLLGGEEISQAALRNAEELIRQSKRS